MAQRIRHRAFRSPPPFIDNPDGSPNNSMALKSTKSTTKSTAKSADPKDDVKARASSQAYWLAQIQFKDRRVLDFAPLTTPVWAEVLHASNLEIGRDSRNRTETGLMLKVWLPSGELCEVVFHSPIKAPFVEADISKAFRSGGQQSAKNDASNTLCSLVALKRICPVLPASAC